MYMYFSNASSSTQYIYYTAWLNHTYNTAYVVIRTQTDKKLSYRRETALHPV